MSDLVKALNISAAGLEAQGTRLRVIAENVANADSAAESPGAEPYRRKVVTFSNVLDRELGVEQVEVKDITLDRSDFGQRFEPGHPAADPRGYIRTPNVNGLLEVADMREAQRSYEANLKAIQSARTMLQQTIDILR